MWKWTWESETGKGSHKKAPEATRVGMGTDDCQWCLLNTSQSIPSQINPDYFSRQNSCQPDCVGTVGSCLPQQSPPLPTPLHCYSCSLCPAAPRPRAVLPACCLPAACLRSCSYRSLRNLPRWDQIWGGRRELVRGKEGVWWIQVGLYPCTFLHHTNLILDLVKIPGSLLFHLVGPSTSKVVYRWVSHKPMLVFSGRDLVTKRCWLWSKSHLCYLYS